MRRASLGAAEEGRSSSGDALAPLGAELAGAGGGCNTTTTGRWRHTLKPRAAEGTRVSDANALTASELQKSITEVATSLWHE